MSKSEIFKAAHKTAKDTKDVHGSYRVALSWALRDAWKNARRPKRDAKALASIIDSAFASYYMTQDKAKAIDLMGFISEDLQGFAADVAASVARYKKCSRKQAWVVACALVENNHPAVYEF